MIVRASPFSAVLHLSQGKNAVHPPTDTLSNHTLPSINAGLSCFFFLVVLLLAAVASEGDSVMHYLSECDIKKSESTDEYLRLDLLQDSLCD